MSLLFAKNDHSARRKIFPALGGFRKKMYPKSHYLEISLHYLVDLLGKLKKKIKMEEETHKEFEELQKVLLMLSRFKKIKKKDFELLCKEMLKKYKI